MIKGQHNRDQLLISTVLVCMTLLVGCEERNNGPPSLEKPPVKEQPVRDEEPFARGDEPNQDISQLENDVDASSRFTTEE